MFDWRENLDINDVLSEPGIEDFPDFNDPGGGMQEPQTGSHQGHEEKSHDERRGGAVRKNESQRGQQGDENQDRRQTAVVALACLPLAKRTSQRDFRTLLHTHLISPNIIRSQHRKLRNAVCNCTVAGLVSGQRNSGCAEWV